MYRIHKGFWTLGNSSGKVLLGKVTPNSKMKLSHLRRKVSVEMGKSHLLLRQSGSSKESYSGNRGKVKKLLGISRDGKKSYTVVRGKVTRGKVITMSV